MTNLEFSNEFDALLNSYNNKSYFGEASSKQDIVLDEYEKSVFLTASQEEIVKELYSGKNSVGDSFEKSEEVRRYLSSLVKTAILSPELEGSTGISVYSIFYQLPDDMWFITFEEATISDSSLGCWNGATIEVLPITQDEYHRIMNNPFRGTNKRRALRLDINDNKVEIISKYNIKDYLVRYMSKPSPIVLNDMPEENSINGIYKKTECALSPSLHRDILERAVRMALMSKTILKQ